MKGIIKVLISLVLAASIFLTVLPVSAARPGATEFLSELHMAQASTADEAKKMLTDAGYKVIDKNLNPNGGDAVYLGYKTSTNVEDAITDISIMNMYGGYSITDYDVILEESLREYKDMIQYFRTAANEFAENYKAGTKEAKLAYRQLNYYYVEQNKEKVYMGDYMLNFPSTDDEFANILLKGNWHILGNIRTLLAMGVGDGETTLADRISAITNDESVYLNGEHYNNAKTLYQTYIGVDQDIKEIESSIQSIEEDTSLSDTDKQNYIQAQQALAAKYIAFKISLEALPYKNSTYGEYLAANPEITDYSVFYPIIEAMTPGQRALMPFGQSISLIIYDAITKADEDLEAELQEVENEFTPISVYLGTDLSIFNGSFAVTTDALRAEGATGTNWINSNTNADAGSMAYAIGFGVGGVATLAVSGVILAKSAASLYKYNTLVDNITTLGNKINVLEDACDTAIGQANMNDSVSFDMDAADLDIDKLNSEYIKSTNELGNMPSGASLKVAVAGSVIGVVVGLVMIGISIYNIVKIVNSYKVEYLDIPSNMVDCKATENGDRFIRYSVVESFYKDGGKLKTRAGDTNAYNGEQWVSIYYTKNYEAGKCMLAKHDIPTNEYDFGKYTPVHGFGKNNCYDLNKYSGKSNAEKIFLAFQNSNAKKAAETEVPTVVGSMVNYGMLAISGVIGIGIGMGIMAIINKRNNKKNNTKKEITE